MSSAAAPSQLAVRSVRRPAGTLSLPSVLQTVDNSLKRSLKKDPSNDKERPNQTPREVFGQWVDVEPTALPDPFVVALAGDMASELGLDPAASAESSFARFV